MTFSLSTDPTGRLVCQLAQDHEHASVMAYNVPEAGPDFLMALQDARDGGLGETLWQEPGGEYRWMFRCQGDVLTVVVLYYDGSIMGWQHVFRAECDFAWFDAIARAALAPSTVA